MHEQINTPSEQRVPHTPRLPYLPGLDGLRGLAVIAVLLYHAEGIIRGGFLGVESFFVLSGFLITALLLAEWQQHGRIDVKDFWLRRARRLLPALLLMLGGTLAFATFQLGGEARGLYDDALAALVYAMNWHLVVGGQSYFDPTLRPSLLQHLWSLAVEEQFYLLWPLLFIAGLRGLRLRGLVLATLVGIVASSALMFWLYQPGADPSRIYYGTDTRAAGLLIGVVLALLWKPGGAEGRRSVGMALDGGGLAALGLLLAGFVRLSDTHPLLYRGGFTLVALSTALLIVAVTYPGARLMPALLGWRPLRWVGLRSYGIYLWHWPVFMVTRPYQDIALDGWPLLALRLLIVLALAELSYRLLELPIRHGVPAWLRQFPAQASAGQTGKRRQTALILSMLLVFTVACAVPINVPASTTLAPTATATPGPSAVAVAASAPTAGSTVVAAPSATATQAASPSAVPPTATTTPGPTETPTEVPLQAFDPALAADLQRILDQTVADGYIPGAVVSVRIPGQQAWVGASGIANRNSGALMDATTLVRIASISKVFTAVVVLQLAEEGQIDLDAPLSTWLPDLVPNGEQITVRNLLQHTSGLYDYLEDRNFVNQAYREPDRLWAPAELVGYATQFPPSFRPGAPGAWDYSSTNYVLLGMIVEQVTGRTLAQEMRQRIFDPLKLENTFFAPEEALQGIQARGYSNNIDQTEVAMSFAFATANIVSSAGDVQRFAQALIDGELLMPATLAQMQTFVDGKGQYRMPELAYGLGLMRNRLPVGPDAAGQARPAEASTVVGHIGGFGGFRSAVWAAPESGIVVALGVNQAATDPNILATRLFDAVLRYQGR